ncbi:hypothetical protein V7S43_007891 [Phytophthora oleae]|uniref:Uncharacterized protein n=1 Tax=Phytophthora oleae TaxID=2107226 RepID=A0ABD3FKS3_9STRA
MISGMMVIAHETTFMLGRRKAKEEAAVKPLTAQDRLNALEKEEVRMVYPVGLLQTFSRQELGRLRKRFVQLIPAEDTSQVLRVPVAALLQMPELRTQPFVPLVARLILSRQTKDAVADPDEDRSGELVSFEVLMAILSVFSAKQSLEFKRRGLYVKSVDKTTHSS